MVCESCDMVHPQSGVASSYRPIGADSFFRAVFHLLLGPAVDFSHAGVLQSDRREGWRCEVVMTPFDSHLAWLDSQEEHALDLLRHWASINTGSYNVAGLRAFAGHLVPAFHTLSPYIAEIPLSPHQTLADDGAPHEHPLGVALSIKCEE